jgi:hypothetical protein
MPSYMKGVRKRGMIVYHMGRSGGCERALWARWQRSATRAVRCSLWRTLSCCREVSFGVLHDSKRVKKHLGRLMAALSECVTERPHP